MSHDQTEEKDITTLLQELEFAMSPKMKLLQLLLLLVLAEGSEPALRATQVWSVASECVR